MKIKFLTTKLNLLDGGGSNTNTDLKARTLIGEGHEVSVITLFSKHNKIPEETPYEIIEEHLQTSNCFPLRKSVCGILKKYERDTDIFHIDGHMYIWAAGLYLKRGGKAKIIAHFDNYMPTMSIHNAGKLSLRTKIATKILRLWELSTGLRQANLVNKMTCASETTLKIYAGHGFDRTKMQIIPAFVDMGRLLELKKEKNDKFTLLYVGRLHPDKGLDTLIIAIKDLDVMVSIVGEGEDKKKLKELATTLNIRNKVNFYSWKGAEELKYFYKSADIFIHPAIWPEPFGMAVVEAMAAGVPVITTKNTGSAEVVGSTGLFFEKGNHKELKKNIETFYNSPTLLQKLSKQAKKRAQNFDCKHSNQVFEQLIEELNSKGSSEE